MNQHYGDLCNKLQEVQTQKVQMQDEIQVLQKDNDSLKQKFASLLD